MKYLTLIILLTIILLGQNLVLQIKAEEFGGQVVAVKPEYTSMTCSECGWGAPDRLILPDKMECSDCGHIEDLDVNAAKNILNRWVGGLPTTAWGGSGSTVGGSPSNPVSAPVNQEGVSVRGTMAKSEYFRCPPRLPSRAGFHDPMASGDSQRVASPRRTRLRSYSAQFATRYLVL